MTDIVDGLLPELVADVLCILDNITRTVLRFTSKHLKGLVTNNYCHGDDFCTKAASKGYANVLKWGISIRLPWDGDLVKAVSEGYLDIVKYVFYCPHVVPTDTHWPSLGLRAVSKGQFEVAQWLAVNCCDVTPKWCTESASRGNKDFTIWSLSKVVSYDDKWKSDMYSRAMMGGNLDLLMWLKKEGYDPGPLSGRCHSAIIGGHTHILQLLREEGYVPEEFARTVVLLGKINVLKWLKSTPEWSDNIVKIVITTAQEFNHHDVLKWVSELD